MPSTQKSTSTAPVWRRPQVLAIAGVLVLALLAGGWFVFVKDGRGAYCDDLKAWNDKSKETVAADADLETSATFLAGSIKRRIDGAADFAASGPDDIQSDWKLFHDRLQDVIDVFKKLGYDLTDAAAVQKFAADLQSGALAQIDPALQSEATAVQAKLADSEATAAINAITKDAKDECKIDLTLSATAVQ